MTIRLHVILKEIYRLEQQTLLSSFALFSPCSSKRRLSWRVILGRIICLLIHSAEMKYTHCDLLLVGKSRAVGVETELGIVVKPKMRLMLSQSAK